MSSESCRLLVLIALCGSESRNCLDSIVSDSIQIGTDPIRRGLSVSSVKYVSPLGRCGSLIDVSLRQFRYCTWSEPLWDNFGQT